MMMLGMFFASNGDFCLAEFRNVKMFNHRGARVLLVKGERVLRDCNLMEHTNLKGSETLKEEVRGGEGISVFHLQQLFTDSQVVGNNTLKNVHESNTQVTTDKDRYFHHTSNQPTAERINEEFEGEDESDYNTERPLPHRPRQSDVSNNYQSLEYGSDISENDSEMLSFLTSHIEKHLNHSTLNFGLTESGNVSSFDVQRKVRHAKSRVRNIKASEMRLDGDKKEFLPGNMKASYKNETSFEKEPVSIMDEALQNKNMRKSRDLHVMDGGIAHAGNAGNYTEPAEDDESSDSSFENVLFECYGKHYLMKKEVSPSDRCARDSTNITYTLLTQHVVKADGYYHYIFYSDNDLNENVINADFEIYKPVFEYTNYSHSCVNQTECSFSLSFWSDEVVVVEVPRHNNLKNIQEVDDIMYLVSSCYPRMAVYIIFPVAVLFLVLVCAFL